MSASPRGQLELLVLSLIADAPTHGYALITRLRDRSGGVFDLPEGTVYPILHKLQQDGRIVSEWEETGGRPRRVYRITRSGMRVLAEQRQMWASYRTAVARVLGDEPWPTAT